ncbi:DUF1801 domain-containing protein [Kitasatospora sp. DSM 101779]|uniref:DUF1801 domain-containing protein n=1 Tax=Kitasatospora sp. DSM 101779 TaxID=2853165 RepID=UPI0021D7E1EC|nr:DUF1801 domain-containing protein [Kitasatospora sp. DSM 101779]MCU7825093.1 DUF1801 domain-containing protein [Kitasatospora sp. DSM 101779]
MPTTTVAQYLDSLPAAQRDIADLLLPLVEAALPGAGAVWHGHPVWSLGAAPGKNPVCFVKSYGSHLTFGFWCGQEIADPSGRLAPGSRTMASVKLRAADEVDAELFAGWLSRARSLERTAA